MADLKDERKLDKRLEGKFKMKGLLPGKFEFKGRKYDTRDMDLETAKKLVSESCPYLEETASQSTTGAVAATGSGGR